MLIILSEILIKIKLNMIQEDYDYHILKRELYEI